MCKSMYSRGRKILNLLSIDTSNVKSAPTNEDDGEESTIRAVHKGLHQDDNHTTHGSNLLEKYNSDYGLPMPQIVQNETVTMINDFRFETTNNVMTELKSSYLYSQEQNLDHSEIDGLHENHDVLQDPIDSDPYNTSDNEDDLDYLPDNEIYSGDESENNVAEPTRGICEDGNDTGNNNLIAGDEAKKKLGRKRKRNSAEWRRNKIKKLRNTGKSYTNWNNKSVAARALGASCGNKCRLKCTNKIAEEQRNKLFNEYWNLGDTNRQRDLIVRFVDFKTTNRVRQRHVNKENDSTTTKTSEEADSQVTNQNNTNDEEFEEKGSRRNLTYYYHLPSEEQEDRVKVCQKMFLNTFGISHQVVKTVAKKIASGRNTAESDRRGRVQCNSKIPESVKDSVRQHINMFETIESHYCRKDSQKSYLPSTLSINKMFSMYEEYCTANNIKNTASKSMYRNIFVSEYNLGFFVPKKDQCDLCTRYENSSENEKLEMKISLDEHLRNKRLSRELKQLAKEKSQSDETFCAATYDLQQILLSPKIEVSKAYYSKKLSTYNLTVFDIGTKKGFCYMWYEGIAARGACEIGSCVFEFIKHKVANGIKEFSFYSDNCPGQNRNRFIYSMYLFCAVKYNVKITHTFLERGHTQSEGDSMHSVIENASRHIPVFTPAQWYAVARTACRKTPYMVKEMMLEDVYDFKQLLNQTIKNTEKDVNGDKVNWTSVKMVSVESKTPNIIWIKYDFEDEFVQINVMERSRKNRVPLDTYQLKPLRTKTIPIGSDKYNALISMCRENAIPKEYHRFYYDLEHELVIPCGQNEIT